MTANKPDFLLVGAMKAGTTTLHRVLETHPDIYMPTEETHFFHRDDRYPAGHDYYLELLGVDDNETRFVGDDTPAYAYIPEVPGRIHAMIPDVKLIWLLRNPVKRAFSNYWHVVKKGNETRSFQKAVRDELKGKNALIWHNYLRRSCYAEQIQRYYQYFPPEHNCFVLMEDMVRAPLDEINRVCTFLNIAPFDDITLPHENKTRYPRIKWFNKLRTYRAVQASPMLYKAVRKLSSLSSYNHKPQIPQQLYTELMGYFADDIAETSRLTGLDTQKWLS